MRCCELVEKVIAVGELTHHPSFSNKSLLEKKKESMQNKSHKIKFNPKT
jgi:hypothetical protein